MFTEKDIDRFLLEARQNKNTIIPQIENVSSGKDAADIKNAISNSDFVAEDFCRYDSDVCEQFLSLMVKVGIAKL